VANACQLQGRSDTGFDNGAVLDISNEVGLVKSVWCVFLFLSHTPLQPGSPVVFSDGRCTTILEFSSLSNLRARSVSLHRLGVPTKHLSDHVRP